MYNSGDAAEQVVRISLEGTEVALKLTGSAAKNIAAMLYAVWKNRDKNKTKGHQRLSAMPQSGPPFERVRPAGHPAGGHPPPCRASPAQGQTRAADHHPQAAFPKETEESKGAITDEQF